MILFHGTVEENLKSIKKYGLQGVTKDQWIMEVTKKNVCCLANQPTAGEGGNPIYFAGRHKRANNQNGYLVIVSMELKIIQQKLITIFDNKTLDDYVCIHFYLREEFRQIGYPLYNLLKQWKSHDPKWKKIDKKIEVINKPVSYQQDQQTYFREISKGDKTYKFIDIKMTEDFLQFVWSMGWARFYEFLSLHFSNVKLQAFEAFQKNAPQNNGEYWELFYKNFPLDIDSPRLEHIRHWFSPEWLRSRQLPEIADNRQILVSSVEPEHIVGYIQVTNSSGIVPQFRPRHPQFNSKPKYTLANRIWREVYRMVK